MPGTSPTRSDLPSVAALLFAAVLLLAVPPADAQFSDASGERFCVLQVGEVQADGNFALESYRCFASSAEADNYTRTLTTLGLSTSGVSTQTTEYTLGVHYSGAGGTGSALSVVGTTCSGGGIPSFDPFWDNNIEHTQNKYCGRIRHYANPNYGGSTEDTGPAFTNHDLTTLSDLVSSTRYFSS